MVAMTPSPDTPEGLAPCPFCGPGQSMVSVHLCDFSKRWKVGCGRCGSHTGVTPRAEDDGPQVATARWNQRPRDATIERLTAENKALRHANNPVGAKIMPSVINGGDSDPVTEAMIEAGWSASWNAERDGCDLRSRMALEAIYRAMHRASPPQGDSGLVEAVLEAGDRMGNALWDHLYRPDHALHGTSGQPALDAWKAAKLAALQANATALRARANQESSANG